MQAYARKGVSRCFSDDDRPIIQLGHAKGEPALPPVRAPLLSSDPFCLHTLSLKCASLTQTENWNLEASCFHTNSLPAPQQPVLPMCCVYICLPVLICASLGVLASSTCRTSPQKQVPCVESICICQARSL